MLVFLVSAERAVEPLVSLVNERRGWIVLDGTGFASQPQCARRGLRIARDPLEAHPFTDVLRTLIDFHDDYCVPSCFPTFELSLQNTLDITLS